MARQSDVDGDPLAPHSLSPSEIKQLIEIDRAGRPVLVLRGQLGALEIFPTDPGGRPLTLGRRPDMDVSIAWDSEVSGLHAELQGFGEEWTIADDGLSTNGTYINGKRISGRHRLRDGDRIRVGRTVLAFKVGGAAQVQKTVSAGVLPEMQELTETQRRVLIALCRPYRDGDSFAIPASNQQIAEELFLGIDAVKMHLRRLFAKFELTAIAQNEKRARLAEHVLQLGVISRRDLD